LVGVRVTEVRIDTDQPGTPWSSEGSGAGPLMAGTAIEVTGADGGVPSVSVEPAVTPELDEPDLATASE